MPKIKIAVLYGGPSGEYEISLRSADAVTAGLSPDKYEICKVHVTKSAVLEDADGRRLLPETGGFFCPDDGKSYSPDVVFPAMHGTFGEDGRIQAILDYTGVPYVGCGVFASAVATDKIAAKALCHAAGVPVLPSMEVGENDGEKAGLAFSYPLFVKPVTGGSSLGASRVAKTRDYFAAYHAAAAYGRVMAEPCVTAREIEVALVETAGGLTVSRPGEVIPGAEFYDYSDKYTTASALTKTVAFLPAHTETAIRDAAATAFRALGCRGLCRADFFLLSDGAFFLNEVNTMPGFTDRSLYPRMAASALGTDFSGLLDHLIAFATGA